jgi:arylsulfatase A-like enzyme
MSVNPHSVRRVFRPWLLGLAVVAAGISACAALAGRPSIVLVTIDTLRPDRIGAYGHPTNKTPALNRLAREGMLFPVAYCDMPWTTGSMSSVMTGQYSSSHGVNLPNMRLKPEALTMAEILGADGYRTAAIVASFPLDSVYGLDQGFESYSDEFTLPMLEVTGAITEHVPSKAPDALDGDEGFTLRKFKNDAYRPDEDVTDAAIKWLRRYRADGLTDGRLPWLDDLLSNKPFFLWVHYFGPHEKLKGDRGIVDQEPDIVAAYNGDVEKSDTAVGRLFDELRALEIMDDSLVIVHADHGQNLGEFGVVGHGMRIDEATVRIPLIMRYPEKIRPGLRREDVARNIDILPTVLELTGNEAGALAGRSLVPAKDDPAGEKVPAEAQTAFFATNLTTIVLRPILVPGYWTVLGPIERSGLRTPEWRFVNDQVVGACTHGGKPIRNPFGAWLLPDGKPLEKEKCEAIRSEYLYPVTPLGDGEPNAAKKHPDVTKELLSMLREHASHKVPLASKIELSPEQEEKLKSLGYVSE